MSGQSPLKHEPLVGKATPERPWPVEAKNLLTERERSLYQSLNKLYPNHKIFVQVALSQLIDIDSRHPERNSIRARFKQLVADFVLCRADLSLVAVIELDDRTHERAVRQAADARKNKVLTASAPVLPGRIAEDAEAKRAHMQETSALAKEKNLAWAAFYSAPASCEHPVDWNAQVECGNQYMRAKRAFEQNWAAEHSSSQGIGAAVILDGRSVAGGQK